MRHLARAHNQKCEISHYGCPSLIARHPHHQFQGDHRVVGQVVRLEIKRHILTSIRQQFIINRNENINCPFYILLFMYMYSTFRLSQTEVTILYIPTKLL